MRANLPQSGDQGLAPGAGSWEDLDTTPIALVAGNRRSAATLVGAVLALGVVVGAGLWPIDSAAPLMEPAAAVCLESPGPEIVDDDMPDGVPPAAASVAITPPPSTDVLMPGDGDVVLGPSVAVAGHAHGLRSGSQNVDPAALLVSVLIGDEMVGQAEVAIVDGQFVGTIEVVEQAEGRIAELQVSDSRRPEQVIVTRTFVLGPTR
jgi:hypothetical protein